MTNGYEGIYISYNRPWLYQTSFSEEKEVLTLLLNERESCHNEQQASENNNCVDKSVDHFCVNSILQYSISIDTEFHGSSGQATMSLAVAPKISIFS